MCAIALKSMTYAMKAKKALNDNYINADVIKLAPNMTKKGCPYGVRFDCVNLTAVQDVLRNGAIKYTELINL